MAEENVLKLMNSSDVAILLLNWNGIDLTVPCVESLLNSKTSFDFDIYILDQASKNDESNALKKKFEDHRKVTVIRSSTNIGFAAGNNFLIEEAKKVKNYQYFLLLNNDTVIPDGLMEDFLKKVDGRVGVFGPEVRYFSDQKILQSTGGKVNLWTGICSRIGDKIPANEFPKKDLESECGYIFGCAILIHKDVVEKIGLLDSDLFIYYEEVDYCITAKKNGFQIKYIPAEYVAHKDSVTTRKISGFHIYTMWRNRIHFLKKHASLWQYLVSFVYLALYFVYFTLKYGLKEGKYMLLGTIDGLQGKKGNPMLHRTF